ncbi:hypothetical protein [Ancylobacter rudongensis]|uniref:hypothetical protein n=1 Tax=Ancylobacter rudongensis TaxID=177413 RepID=UPI00115FF5B9|nr:hypothetical protein [Ancylobacter rudongensis]
MPLQLRHAALIQSSRDIAQTGRSETHFGKACFVRLDAIEPKRQGSAPVSRPCRHPDIPGGCKPDTGFKARLPAEQLEVIRGIREGAHVMVCGGRQMAVGVAEAMTRMLEPLGLSHQLLKAEGRYVEDVY